MKTNRIEKAGRLPLITFVLVMLLCTAVSAKTVALKYDKEEKKYYTIYSAQESETISFRMPVKYNGLLFVDGIRENISTGSTGGVALTMYNAKGDRLDFKASNYVDATTGTGVTYAVSPGNYYFRVKVSKNNNYLIRAGYLKGSSMTSPKGGVSKAKAYTLARNRAAGGLISAAAYSVRKWFRFYVPKESRPVKLHIQISGGQGYTTVYAAGPNKGSTRKIRIKAGNETPVSKDLYLYQPAGAGSGPKGPKPGWYYVLFTKGTGNEKYSSGQVAVKWSYY